jgi:hypothetical protein
MAGFPRRLHEEIKCKDQSNILKQAHVKFMEKNAHEKKNYAIYKVYLLSICVHV